MVVFSLYKSLKEGTSTWYCAEMPYYTPDGVPHQFNRYPNARPNLAPENTQYGSAQHTRTYPKRDINSNVQ